MKPFCISFLLVIFGVFDLNAQVSEEWVIDQLKKYSPISYAIVQQFKQNGSKVSFNGNTVTAGMAHFQFVNLISKKDVLSTIATNLHETTHSIDSQLPLMLAKNGLCEINSIHYEGFYIDEHLKWVLFHPKTKLFPCRELSMVIPDSLKTFRYATYIESKSVFNSTQSSGVIGLLDEFNAYYHGALVIYDLLPLFKEVYPDKFVWNWYSNFSTHGEAFYEFDFFIKEYLLFAKKHYPDLYNELKNNDDFLKVYGTIRNKYENLISSFEWNYKQLLKTQKNEEYLFTNQSKNLCPVLKRQLSSQKYREVEEDFLKGKIY